MFETNKKFQAKWYHRFLVRYWFVIIIVVVISLFSLEYFLVISPNVKQTKNGRALDVETHKKILEEQRQYLQGLKALNKEAVKLSEDNLKKLDYVVAQDVDLPKILNKIDILIKQSNLEVLQYGVGWENGEITMNFGFTNGDYAKVKDFLKDIEKNIRIMDVTSISLKEVGNLVSLTIKSYYLK